MANLEKIRLARQNLLKCCKIRNFQTNYQPDVATFRAGHPSQIRKILVRPSRVPRPEKKKEFTFHSLTPQKTTSTSANSTSHSDAEHSRTTFWPEMALADGCVFLGGKADHEITHSDTLA
uniref:(northern house mosquito) hypothetical protein n=1 Tax=Culex pipiens TaxID=7175 RepID=A0A8D8P0T8_CULPI